MVSEKVKREAVVETCAEGGKGTLILDNKHPMLQVAKGSTHFYLLLY